VLEFFNSKLRFRNIAW